MQKLIQTNEGKTIYKISESNIYNVIVVNIETQTIKTILDFTILPNGYLKFERSLHGEIIVLFEEEKIDIASESAISSKLKTLEDAIMNRVSYKEINKFIEKFKVLK